MSIVPNHENAIVAPAVFGVPEGVNPVAYQDTQEDHFVIAHMTNKGAIDSFVEFPQTLIQEDDSTIGKSGGFIRDKTSNTSRTIRSNLVRIVGVSAAAISTIGSVGLAVAESSASAKNRPIVHTRVANNRSKQKLNCGQYQAIMSPGQVAKAIKRPMGHTGQSIIGIALSAAQHADPSEKYVTRQPGSTDLEMDAYYHSKLSGSNALGTYVLEIGYNGRLAPKSINSIRLLEVPGTFDGIFWRSHAQYLRDRYSFWISKGEYENDGPKGINWSVTVDYGQKSPAAGTFALYSALADGARFAKPDLNLTPGTLRSVGTEFINVTKKAEAHAPINYQPIPSRIKNERTCSV